MKGWISSPSKTQTTNRLHFNQNAVGKETPRRLLTYPHYWLGTSAILEDSLKNPPWIRELKQMSSPTTKKNIVPNRVGPFCHNANNAKVHAIYFGET